MGIESRSENHTIILSLTGEFLEEHRLEFKQAIQEVQVPKPRQIIVD